MLRHSQQSTHIVSQRAKESVTLGCYANIQTEWRMKSEEKKIKQEKYKKNDMCIGKHKEHNKTVNGVRTERKKPKKDRSFV